MFHYDDMSDPNDPFVKLLSDKGYSEVEREAYFVWKVIRYTNGDVDLTFKYSRKAGNLKRVYVEGSWGSATDLHVDAMHFESRVAKYIPGESFEEKLRELIANPHLYCTAAHREHDAEDRRCAEVLDFSARE